MPRKFMMSYCKKYNDSIYLEEHEMSYKYLTITYNVLLE